MAKKKTLQSILTDPEVRIMGLREQVELVYPYIDQMVVKAKGVLWFAKIIENLRKYMSHDIVSVSSVVSQVTRDIGKDYGLYLTNLGDAVYEVHGVYKLLRHGNPGNGNKAGIRIEKRTKLLYNDEEKLHRFIKRKTQKQGQKVLHYF